MTPIRFRRSFLALPGLLLVGAVATACGEPRSSEEQFDESSSSGGNAVAPAPGSGGSTDPAASPSTGGSTEGPPDVIDTPPTGQISVSASSSDTNVPENVLDGSLGTRWSAYGEGEWLLIDLGETVSLSSVDLAFFQGNVRATHFDLLVGTDTETLTSVYSGTSSGTTYHLETYSFTEQEVRYIKIVGNGTTDGLWTGVSEVRWEGFDPTTPIVVIEPPEPDPGGAPEIPSDLLDLSYWKITLPIGSPEDPDEIELPELNNYEHSQYFFVNEAATGVVFRAHSGGVSTENSGYPRSELREMTGSNGQNQADWSTTSGTHVMRLVGSITRVPLNKPHVVVGQIHDDQDDVIMIRFEGATPGTVTGSGELFVESDGDNLVTLDSNYVLGETYDVVITAGGGRIKVSYNGQQKLDDPFSVNGCYFKAGCYTQSKTNNEAGFQDDASDDFSEVVIYDLTVSHN